MTDEEKRPTRGERCYAAMDRVMTVLTDEFEDLGPPELVFVLSWLQHRYLAEVNAIVHQRSRRPPEDTAPH